jgi:outer membrane protein OmpA-like peptidoglycan-associated protein
MNRIHIKPTLAAIALFMCTICMAQYTKDYKRNADAYYAKGEWYTAAQYYEKYLEQQAKPSSSGYEPYTVQGSNAKKKTDAASAKDSKAAIDNNEVVYRIAECYRQLNDHGKAEPYYAKAASFDKGTYPLAQYRYAVSLRANAKYAEAEKQFSEFAKSHTTKDAYTEQTKVELANLRFIQDELKKKDIQLYKVSRLGGGAVSGAGANYAASFADGSIVFTSSRADSSVLSSRNKNPYINTLYKAAASEGVVGTVSKLELPTAEGFEQGTSSFTADGNRVYITRWKKENGRNVSSVFMSNKKNGAWGEPIKLGTNVNADGHSSKQPYVSADGSWLLYSSDREGGKGKFDLWYAALNSDGEPGSFTNLGSSINTKGDEEAPFYSVGTGSLVFASNGMVGMGGLDLYESKGSVPASWGTAVNLGYPVNSIKDDSYFANKGSDRLLQGAVISTDRSSACCLELFSVAKEYRKYVTGIVNDCRTGTPLASANLKVKGVIEQATDNGGRYFFEVKSFAPMELLASKAEYRDSSFAFNRPMDPMADTLVNAVFCIAPVEKIVPPPDTPVVKVEPEEQVALFDFAKYSLRPETAVLLDTLAAVLKREPSLGLEILGYTDAQGTNEYNLKLSQQRADACRDYLIKQGVAASKLKATGKGECCPVKPDVVDGKDSPENRQLNRRVEFKVLFIRK